MSLYTDEGPVVGRCCQLQDDWRGHCRGNTYLILEVEADGAVVMQDNTFAHRVAAADYREHFSTLSADLSAFAQHVWRCTTAARRR